jgi:C-terminal processing protease CtpA/Prc
VNRLGGGSPVTFMKRFASVGGWALAVAVFGMGIWVWRDVSYTETYEPVAESLSGMKLGSAYAWLSKRTVDVTVIEDVMTSGPADLAGARAGDIVLGISDTRPAADYFAFEAGDSKVKLLRKIMQVAGGEAVDLVLLRPNSKDFETTHAKIVVKLIVPDPG